MKLGPFRNYEEVPSIKDPEAVALDRDAQVIKAIAEALRKK